MLKSVSFEVIGDQKLHCESCEHRVERALKPVPGISQVRAHARNQRIDVLFDTAVLDPGAIAERIGQVGYETRIGAGASEP
ncbi:MAG: heavy-metal-associated domain-containing protein [Acidobacteriota bacterium]|nr:heavy-metal-associated domain-containing protein [Acidobacteriota bacterium]